MVQQQSLHCQQRHTLLSTAKSLLTAISTARTTLPFPPAAVLVSATVKTLSLMSMSTGITTAEASKTIGTAEPLELSSCHQLLHLDHHHHHQHHHHCHCSQAHDNDILDSHDQFGLEQSDVTIF